MRNSGVGRIHLWTKTVHACVAWLEKLVGMPLTQVDRKVRRTVIITTMEIILR